MLEELAGRRSDERAEEGSTLPFKATLKEGGSSSNLVKMQLL